MIHGLAHYMQAFVLVAGCSCAADKQAGAAETTARQQPVVQEQQAVSASQNEQVTIDRSACRYLVKHQPRADVDFQPGIDIRGRAVAPAELDDRNELALPETVTVDMTPELTKWLPNANPPYDRLSNSKINIGTITLSGDTLMMNGRPLDSGVQENLAVLCLQQTR